MNILLTDRHHCNQSYSHQKAVVGMGAKELILLSSTLHENTKYICLFCHARTRDKNIKTPVVVK